MDNVKGKGDGLTIALGLDAVNVEEGMKSLKRQLGTVNSEMKANLSAFDKSEKSMERYEATLKGLNEKLKIQKQMFKQAETGLKKLNADYKDAKGRVGAVESEYKKLVEVNKKNKLALDKSNLALKESNKELKKAQDQQKRTNASRDRAFQKLEQLRKAEEDLKNSNKATTAELKKAAAAVQKQSNTHKALVEKYKLEHEQVKKLKEGNKSLSASNEKVLATYSKTNTQLKSTEKEYNDLNKIILNHNKNLADAQKKVNNEKAALNNLSRKIEQVEASMKKFNQEQQIANSGFTKLAKKYDEVSGKFDKIGSGMRSFGRNMSLYVTTPIAGAMGFASKLGVTFDDSMRKVQATSGATRGQLEQLKAKAREMGATTKFSASDSAEALNYMALAGWKTNDMMKGLSGIMDLAAASGEDLAQVSDIVTDGLTAFGLKAQDSGHFADVLAKASANANTNVTMLGEAFKYAAPVAGALGYTIEDTSIAIGLMSNAGIKGEKAGTALRTMFTNLSKPTKAMGNEMERLGISITDSNGKMFPMREVLDQLRDKFSSLTKKQQASAAATIFGKESMSGALAVINASKTDYDKLTEAIDNSEGSAKKMSKTMEGGLGGSLRELRSAAEELGLSVFETVQPTLTKMVSGLKATVDFLNALPKGAKAAVVGFSLLAAATGPVFIAGGLLASAVSKAAKGYANLNRQMAQNTILSKTNSKTMKSLGLETLLLGSSSSKASKGFKGLSASLLTNLKPMNVLKNSAKLAVLPFSLLKKGIGLATKGLFSFGGGVKGAGIALRFLTGPVGATITAITIAVKIFKTAYERVEWFRKGVDGLGETIKFFGGRILGGAIKKLGDFKKFLGKVGQTFKERFSKDMKEGYKSLNDDDLLKVGVNKFKGFMETMGTASKKASDTVKVLGKGVSKETEKALETYVSYSEKSDKIFEQIKLNSGDITKAKADELLKIETELSANLVKEIQKRNADELKETQKLLNDRSFFDAQEKENILKRAEENGKIRLEKNRELEEKIKDLKQKALSDGKLSESERAAITKLEEERKELVVKELSKTEKEQERIILRMQENRSALSVKEASRAVKDAEKARLDRKKEIEKQYEDEVIATKNSVVLNQEEKDSKLRALKLWKDSELRENEDKKKKTVGIVKSQNKDIEKEMDLSSGRVYKNTEKWWNGIKDWWNGFREDQKEKSDAFAKEQEETARKNRENIKKWFGNAWEDVKDKTGEAFSKMGKNAKNFGGEMSKMWEGIKGIPGKIGSGWHRAKNSVSHHTKAISKTVEQNSKSVWKSTSKWFSNAYKSAKGWLSDMASKSRTKWDDISSTAWSNAKSVWRGTSKWFSNSYKSLKGWTGDMYSRAHDRFDAISSSAWSNAKSVYNGFRKWLSRTLDWIRNIGGDMGRAAANLGKNVANKAIGGLNKMIGGINKISKAITDKTLIKPIPTLSTGTFKSKSVATDSTGALTQPTLAVLNDKGSGNAPGGGVQEVIHRADGTFHAPQGRDVVVPLNIGDSVINAQDTLKLQRMGFLPKFHRGTKKKDWLDSASEAAADLLGGAKKHASQAKRVAKDKSKNVIDKAREIGGDALEKAEDAAKGIWGGIKGVVDDVGEFLENPGALVEKVMNFMKINFGGGTNATVKMAKGAYHKLKKSLVDKVKSWFEESGGAGDGGYIDLWRGINFGFARSAAEARAQGYPFSRPHHGIDVNYPYGTKVYSTIAGKATGSHGYNGGFGNMMQIISGAIKVIYGHLSKLAFTGSKQVRPGSFLGLSGGDPARQGAGAGSSTGPHLHYEMQWNGVPKDPIPWLKKNNGKGKGKSGVNKAASAWAGDIRRAAKRMRVSVTSGDVANIISLIQHESGGNAGITQSSSLRDINVLQGNPAKGLLQYIPQTFRHYAVRGHGNIYSGYDQLLAFFNNRYWRSQFNPRGGWSPSGPRRYANGGLITRHQFAEVGEGNKPELVVPLTRRQRAMQLIEQGMRYIGAKEKETTIQINGDNKMIEKLLQRLVLLSNENNSLTKVLTETLINLSSPNNQTMDVKGLEKIISRVSGERVNNNSYAQGGII
ncbi:phage tail tape measure protein [Staphylococcus aureus]|uniref:phage tail tape measure protein n=1 Tax=Staphylococcus aureus TaxID=1280 RepID=UPI00045079EC|nr:phage tail tape measure protein [Staphylococcus aureus]EZY61436.1 phage tail tape measure protein, TP901 family, core region [Staphylococcus aureus R0294]EZY64226.1 phage tail tape measure protein, TP901 family, core region [Staphylococcus aureus R0357]EZY69392.1 phage tail tape measure protein, TP901 family, core region [Staphylococcus aureus R0545]EZY72518.1 phage tail tape measure protein, TP901 family, core region [Staphylococcus aureus R0611]